MSAVPRKEDQADTCKSTLKSKEVKPSVYQAQQRQHSWNDNLLEMEEAEEGSGEQGMSEEDIT